MVNLDIYLVECISEFAAVEIELVRTGMGSRISVLLPPIRWLLPLSGRMTLETAGNTSHDIGVLPHIRLHTLRLSGSGQYGLACLKIFLYLNQKMKSYFTSPQGL